MRRLVGIAATLVVLAGCTGSGVEPGPAAGEAGAEAPQPGPSPTDEKHRVGGVDLTEPAVELEPDELPYPYRPAPPEEPTAIDGTYLRILRFEDIGLPPPQSFPIRCLRCAPYYVHAGVSSLILDDGRWWLHHQLSGFETLGHYRVRGSRLQLFNDPNCPDDVGTYRWDVEGYEMTFELVGGDCVWENARAHDLMRVSWTKVDPCVFRFENLWPARFCER